MTNIVIIGGGPAGYEAALVAVAHGGDVTVIESDGIGGACVLYDCVPSKTFIASTGIRTETRRAVDLGIELHFERVEIDVERINARVKDLATAQSADIRARLAGEGVRIIRGRATLAPTASGMAHHEVNVVTPSGGEQSFEADVVLVATGASPRVLESAQPDGEKILTWRQLYDLEELPTHLVVVGSGVTGADARSTAPHRQRARAAPTPAPSWRASRATTGSSSTTSPTKCWPDEISAASTGA